MTITTSVSHEPGAKPTSIREHLVEDHARIDALLSELSEQAAADVRPDLERTWGEVEGAVLAHMDEEEMFLFPHLRSADPPTYAQLAREHAELRRSLGSIGIGIELHAIRAEEIESFAAQLRDHAERENATIYRWAEHSQLPGPRELLRRLVLRRRRSTDPSANGPAHEATPSTAHHEAREHARAHIGESR